MAELATNPQTGEVLIYEGGTWQKAKVAQNASGERIVWDGRAWSPLPATRPDPNQPMTELRPSTVPQEAGQQVADAVKASGQPTGLEKAAGWGRAVQNGLMLGYGDEASAGLQATLDWIGGGNWGDAYDKRLEQGRALDKSFAQSEPTMATLGEGVGGLAGAALLPGVTGLSAETFAGNVGRGALTGGALGGAYGFGTGEGGLQNRLESAGQGALAGGAVGGAFPMLGRLGVSLAKTGMGAFAKKAPEMIAGQKVLENFARDKVPLADALKVYLGRQAKGGASEMLMSQGGKNVLDLARAAAAVPGEGKNIAMTRLAEQIGSEPDVLAGYLGKALGTDSYGGTIDNLLKDRMAASKPLYDQATQSQAMVDVSPILQWVATQAENAVGPQAAALKRIGSYLMDANGQPKATIAQLDAVKKALDADYMNAATDSAIGRGARNLILEAKNELVGLMDAAEPAYQQARQAWAGPSETLQAIEIGKNLLTMPEAELKAAMAKLGPGELSFVRLGLRQGLEEQANKLSDTANLTERLFSKRGVPERLSLVFDDPQGLQDFLGQIERLRRVGRDTRAVLPTTGSQTALREMDQGALEGNPALQFAIDMASGRPVTGLTKAATKALMKPVKGLKEDASRAIVDMLVNKVDPQLIEALLQQQAKANGGNARLARGVLDAIGAGVPVLNEAN